MKQTITLTETQLIETIKKTVKNVINPNLQPHKKLTSTDLIIYIYNQLGKAGDICANIIQAINNPMYYNYNGQDNTNTNFKQYAKTIGEIASKLLTLKEMVDNELNK